MRIDDLLAMSEVAKMFVVRIELHELRKGEAVDYSVLHGLMANAGFERTYGRRKLPNAEYIFNDPEGIDSLLSIRSKVQRLLKKLKKVKGANVLITKAVDLDNFKWKPDSVATPARSVKTKRG